MNAKLIFLLFVVLLAHSVAKNDDIPESIPTYWDPNAKLSKDIFDCCHGSSEKHDKEEHQEKKKVKKTKDMDEAWENGGQQQ
ncbi:hypothetical protein niasHT_013095 [Heterodera trifolii]|uniref:Secreted protein n=1 Tax=Heterodera trifolii TaxID=157864 RepID=A0ABD2L7P1_9BILA